MLIKKFLIDLNVKSTMQGPWSYKYFILLGKLRNLFEEIQCTRMCMIRTMHWRLLLRICMYNITYFPYVIVSVAFMEAKEMICM